MFRYSKLLVLLIPFVGKLVCASDFDWEITPEQGYPVIAFDSANADSEVIFKYNFTGTTDANKFLSTEIYQADCKSPSGNSISFTPSQIGDELQIDVDIDQATITTSPLYDGVQDATTATISFCVRVDYIYKDGGGEEMSINFHESSVVITVDLTANFTLTGISTDRTAADEDAANAELDYPVKAYFCNAANQEVAPGPFAQGSALQVCVVMDSSVQEEIYVDDVLQFVVSQPLGPAPPSTNIANGVTDGLTIKICGTDGICNIMTQLPSKYFVNPSPNDLQIDGMALLAFGSPARKLRARIHGSILAPTEDSRQLQVGQGGENPFQMQVGLVSDVTPITPAAPVTPAKTSDNSMILMAIAAVVVILLLFVSGFGIYVCVSSSKKSNTRDDEEEMRRYAAKMGMDDYKDFS